MWFSSQFRQGFALGRHRQCTTHCRQAYVVNVSIKLIRQYFLTASAFIWQLTVTVYMLTIIWQNMANCWKLVLLCLMNEATHYISHLCRTLIYFISFLNPLIWVQSFFRRWTYGQKQIQNRENHLSAIAIFQQLWLSRWCAIWLVEQSFAWLLPCLLATD